MVPGRFVLNEIVLRIALGLEAAATANSQMDNLIAAD